MSMSEAIRGFMNSVYGVDLTDPEAADELASLRVTIDRMTSNAIWDVTFLVALLVRAGRTPNPSAYGTGMVDELMAIGSDPKGRRRFRGSTRAETESIERVLKTGQASGADEYNIRNLISRLAAAAFVNDAVTAGYEKALARGRATETGGE